MAFQNSVGRIDEACLRAFGTTITHTTKVGVSTTLAGIIEEGVQPEAESPGVYAVLFARSSGFTNAPAAGDEIKIGSKVYHIVRKDADAEGGLKMLLRFHRDVS